MAHVLVRDLEPALVERLKGRAQRHGRSLQGEVKAILEAAAPFSPAEALQAAEQWRKRLTGRMTSESGDLLRADRDR